MEKALYFGGTADVAVATSATKVFSRKDISGNALLSVTLENKGANALVACVIKKKIHPNGVAQNFFGGTDFDSLTNGAIEFVSTIKPHSLAASAVSFFQIWISGATEVELWLTADTGGTSVEVMGNLQNL